MKTHKLVFVVENDHLNEEKIREHFTKDHSHEFIYFKSSAECLQELYLHPMAILVDHELKSINKDERDALKFLDKIRELDHHTKVVFFSKEEGTEAAKDMIQHGAYDYIVLNNANSFLRLRKSLSNIEDLIKHKKSNSSYKLFFWISLLIYASFVFFIFYTAIT